MTTRIARPSLLLRARGRVAYRPRLPLAAGEASPPSQRVAPFVINMTNTCVCCGLRRHIFTGMSAVGGNGPNVVLCPHSDVGRRVKR